MSGYSTYTVTQLKDLLKTRGLEQKGLKSDLIARLEEADSIEAALEEEEEEKEAKVEEPTAPVVEETKVEEPVAEEKKEEPAPAATEETKTEEPTKEVKTITPEELKEAAVTLLNTKINRAKKFNQDADVSRLEGDLKRVEKFGVALDSHLAVELGFKAPTVKDGKPFHKRKFGNNRNRGFKNRNGGGNRRGGFNNNRRGERN